MSKTLAAINITAREQFGESQYLSKYSNQLVELMQPVALRANQDLYSAEYQEIVATAQAMLDSRELNSVQEAQQYINDAFQMYLNPAQAMSNGTTMQKWVATSTYSQGGIDSPATYLRNLVNNTREAYNWANGDSLSANIIGNSLGARNFRYINTNKSGETDKLIDKYQIKSLDALEDIYDSQVESADDFNTTSDQWEKWMTNMTADIGDIKNSIGDKLWGLGEVIVKGITGYLGLKFLGLLSGGKIGTWLSGTASKVGSIAGGALAVGGGIAIGVSAANMIKGAIEGAIDRTNDSNISAAENQLQGTNLEGNNTASTLKGLAMTQDSNNNNFGNQFGAAWNKTTRWLGVGTFGWTRDLKTINEDDWRFFQETNIIQNGDEKAKMAYNLAWGLLLWSAGRQSDISHFSGLNADEVSAIMNEYGWTKAYLDKIVNHSSFHYKPNKSKDQDQEQIDWDKLKIPNIHRAGLDEVPYDDYIAHLHEGEAVLTASTANELRNLLDEYRSSAKANVQFDVIIQQQTVALCNKLDEVISTINISGADGYTSMSTMNQNLAKSLIQKSMAMMRSTKDALY